MLSIFLCLGPLSKKIRPRPRLIDPFRNMLAVYGEGLLAPRPTPKLEDHPLSFEVIDTANFVKTFIYYLIRKLGSPLLVDLYSDCHHYT
jgi:hypothetical protein